MKITTLLTAALVVTGLAQSAGAQTLKKVADSNKITVAYRESSIPFSYLAGPSQAIGFSVDIADAIVAAVRVKTNRPQLEVGHIAVTSQNRIPLLQNGTYDIECGSTTNNTGRGKDVAFTINHFYTGTKALVKKSSNIKNWADLKGKSVASTTGTSNVLVLRKFNADKDLQMDFIYGKDHNDSMLLLEGGRAVAFGMDDVLLYGLMANAKDPSAYEVVGDALQVEPYACMLRKDDPEFKALVDATVKGLMQSGQFAKMHAKWFMSPIPPKGINLNLPMNDYLLGNLKAFSDQPLM